MLKITAFTSKKVVNVTLPLKNDVWVARVPKRTIYLSTHRKIPNWPKIDPQVDQDSDGSPQLRILGYSTFNT